MAEGDASHSGIIAAEFPEGVKPVLTVTSRVATRDWAVDFAGERRMPKMSAFLQPTKMIPTDGIVKEKATKIVKGATTDETRRERSMSGLLRRLTAIRKRAGVAQATFGSCWSRGIWEGSVPILTRSMWGWRER